MSGHQKVQQLLKDLNARLVRNRKHEIWGLPGGALVTLPKTPSDHRAWENSYHDLRRVAGLIPVKTDQPAVSRNPRAYRPKYNRRTRIMVEFEPPKGPARDLASQLAQVIARS